MVLDATKLNFAYDENTYAKPAPMGDEYKFSLTVRSYFQQIVGRIAQTAPPYIVCKLDGRPVSNATYHWVPTHCCSDKRELSHHA